jgi:hypothetical protein
MTGTPAAAYPRDLSRGRRRARQAPRTAIAATR